MNVFTYTIEAGLWVGNHHGTPSGNARRHVNIVAGSPEDATEFFGKIIGANISSRAFPSSMSPPFLVEVKDTTEATNEILDLLSASNFLGSISLDRWIIETANRLDAGNVDVTKVVVEAREGEKRRIIVLEKDGDQPILAEDVIFAVEAKF